MRVRIFDTVELKAQRVQKFFPFSFELPTLSIIVPDRSAGYVSTVTGECDEGGMCDEKSMLYTNERVKLCFFCVC